MCRAFWWNISRAFEHPCFKEISPSDLNRPQVSCKMSLPPHCTKSGEITPLRHRFERCICSYNATGTPRSVANRRPLRRGGEGRILMLFRGQKSCSRRPIKKFWKRRGCGGGKNLFQKVFPPPHAFLISPKIHPLHS